MFPDTTRSRHLFAGFAQNWVLVLHVTVPPNFRRPAVSLIRHRYGPVIIPDLQHFFALLLAGSEKSQI